jgi:hypothetical protein
VFQLLEPLTQLLRERIAESPVGSVAGGAPRGPDIAIDL